jgi:hypothetical protein
VAAFVSAAAVVATIWIAVAVVAEEKGRGTVVAALSPV